MLLWHYCLLWLLAAMSPGMARRRRHRPETAATTTLGPITSTREPPLGALGPSPKRYKCGLHISNNNNSLFRVQESQRVRGCRCSKQLGTLSITCFKAGLRTVPKFDLGPTVVRTMNLEQNKITEIDIGDFFGIKIERLLLANNSIGQLNFLAFWGLEYNLDTLDLSFNKFTSVPADSLRLLRNVRTLSFKGNKITQLRNYEFSYLHKLEVLSLDKNPISFIEDRTFASTNLFMLILDDIQLENGLKTIPTRDLKDLKGLSLKHNNIDVIPNGWLRNLSSLKYLNLDDNKLNFIPDDAFVGVAQTLRKLQMNHNKIRKLPKAALRLLTNLESLELSHNRIKKVYARSFNNSRALCNLDLSHNLIYSLGVSSLQGLDRLVRLDLRYNELITLDDRTFFWPNITDRKIFIYQNPWLCNCLLKWLKKAHRKRQPLAGLFADLLDARCERPAFLEHRPLVRVPLRDFTCNHDYYYYQTDDDYYVYEEEEEDEDEEEEDYDVDTNQVDAKEKG